MTLPVPIFSWPPDAAGLRVAQQAIAALERSPWTPPDRDLAIGGCFICFPRGVSGTGDSDDPAWASAVVMRGREVIAQTVVTGTAGAAYEAGLLALREGPLLEAAVRALPSPPEVLLVNATGLDHPRGCGLAVHLGAMLSLPTVGVTHRPLLATGAWPPDTAGATAPLRLGSDVVGYWLRTKPGTRPLAVHAGWRTTPETAVDVVRRSVLNARTPAPLRLARENARLARQASGG